MNKISQKNKRYVELLSSFRGEDLNLIFHQNMPYLHNWYKSTERTEGEAVRHNFERETPKDHPCQAWFNLVQ